MAEINGKNACVASFIGVGAVGGAIGTAGSLTGLLGGAALGWVCGSPCCSFKIFRDFFDDKIPPETFKMEVTNAKVRVPIIQHISNQLSLNSDKSDTLLTYITSASISSKKQIKATKDYLLGANHPATGRAKHGVTEIKRAIA